MDAKKLAKVDEPFEPNETASIDCNNARQKCINNEACENKGADNFDNSFEKDAIIFVANKALNKSKMERTIQKLRRFDLLRKNFEQIKSISAGLLLLSCGGLHIAWAISQVYAYDTVKNLGDEANKTNATRARVDIFKKHLISERAYLMFTIVMWYIGMMLGSIVAAWYFVPAVQKRNIYYFSALVVFVSGCLFYEVDAAGARWQALLTFGRFVAGIAQGLTYVTIITQATENAAKDFRRILFSIIGGTMGFSIFFATNQLSSITSFEWVDENGNVAEMNARIAADNISITSVLLALISVIFNYLFTSETVPFLLCHNFREEEAQFLLAKLLGEDSASEVVQNEFRAIQVAILQDYEQFEKDKIFKPNHRGLLSIAASARLAAVGSFNITTSIFFLSMLRLGVTNSILDMNDTLPYLGIAVEAFLKFWLLFGLCIMFLANKYNWKRIFHFLTFLAGVSTLVLIFLNVFGVSKQFIYILTIPTVLIYLQFLSLPIDAISLTYLAECFPASTRIRSTGFVAMLECGFNIILATIDFRHYQNEPEFILIGLVLTICGLKLFRVVPNTDGLSLADVKLAYIKATAGKKWWLF